MNCIESRCDWLVRLTIGIVMMLLVPSAGSAAAQPAFAEKFVIRLSSYEIRDADTDLTVLSSDQIGTGFNFVDDLGGDDRVTVPRLDGYFRFKDVHRIEFSKLRIERDGRNLLAIDLDIGDQTYIVGDTVVSNISYEVLKLGYAYSFYQSPEVELALTAGINMTDYEFEYELVDGSSEDTSKASGPLPMFGVRMSYAINRHWSLHYLSEVLFVDTSDAEGSFTNYELDIRYRFNKSFMLGAGLTRFSFDITSEDPDWRGRIADTHQGILISAGYYLE